MSDDKIIGEVIAEDNAKYTRQVELGRNLAVTSGMTLAEERALRQQLADVSNERDELRKQREAILMQARAWAGEAKTQRSTIESVGAILGGIPDWGPIAAGVEELKDRLKASEARNAQAEELFRIVLHCDFEMLGAPVSDIESFLAQSAPATCKHIWVSADNRGAGAGEICQACSAHRPEPATDEQGTGS